MTTADTQLPPRRPRRGGWKPGHEGRSAMMLLAPVMAVLMAVAVFPIAYSFYLSFFQIKLTRPNRTPFVWFRNYTDLLHDALFWTSVEKTVIFALISVSAIAVIALGVALLLNQEFRGPPRDLDRAAGALGNSLRRRRADVEMDLQLRLRRAERGCCCNWASSTNTWSGWAIRTRRCS